ncbi:MAG TPA: Wzz/FepE/Etk N-terminal domain-containing protein [Solirubrobacteraceae bacterium]|nr:Wzz/FepE/Etk N-terminal domain-containing protein [Solirubrobacteraceae bacterium]
MELNESLKILWSRKLVTGAIVLLAIVSAVAVRFVVKSTPSGAATVQILVDSPDSALANLSQETVPLTTRASVLAQVMTSAGVLEQIAKASHVPAAELTAQGPYSGAGQSLNVITPSEARSTQLVAEGVKYRLTFVAQTNEPVVTASVQAPTAAAAANVAAGVYPGVQAYVTQLQKQSRTPAGHQVTIRQLGPPQAGPVSSSTRSTLMAAALLGVLLLGLLGLLGIEGVRRRNEEHLTLEREYLSDLERLSLHAGTLPQIDSEAPTRAGLVAPAPERR